MNAVRPPYYYRLVIALAYPIYRGLLYYKRHHGDYARQIGDRFGQTDYQKPKGVAVIWCHAVSLGELNTAYPLLTSLLDDGYGLYITSTTQTGFHQAGKLFAKWLAEGRVVHGFVPVDKPAIIAKFIHQVCPDMALFVETELWANTLYALAHQNIPSVMINARLVATSFERYRRFGRLSDSMMMNLSYVIAQDKLSQQRFVALGLDKRRAVVADSLKWSQAFALPQTSIHFGNRPIWTAGSTHAGEEQACLVAHQAILAQDCTALLILVPRHPERFDEVYQLCQDVGLITARRSQTHDEQLDNRVQVYLADSMGELLAWYQAGQVAFVGGSLVAIGGHNPIEPAHLARPVIMGQYTKACQHLLDELMAVGGAVQIDKANELAQAVARWLFDQSAANTAGQAAYQLSEHKKNASCQQKAHLLPYLPNKAIKDG